MLFFPPQLSQAKRGLWEGGAIREEQWSTRDQKMITGWDTTDKLKRTKQSKGIQLKPPSSLKASFNSSYKSISQDFNHFKRVMCGTRKVICNSSLKKTVNWIIFLCCSVSRWFTLWSTSNYGNQHCLDLRSKAQLNSWTVIKKHLSWSCTAAFQTSAGLHCFFILIKTETKE